MTQKMPFLPVTWAMTEEYLVRLALYQPDIPAKCGQPDAAGRLPGGGVDIIEPCGFLLSATAISAGPGMDYRAGMPTSDPA